MSVYCLPLNFTPGVRKVYLRELSGRDEQSVEDTGTLGALQLVDKVLVDMPDAEAGPGKASQLTVADRDLILASIYQKAYGNKIGSTLNCQKCGAPFDMDFSLPELMKFIHSKEKTASVTQMEDGSFLLENGPRFRLPTGEDELAILGLPPEEAEQELIRHCLVEGTVNGHLEQFQSALQVLAPMLSTEMKAFCPECGHEMSIQFDLQSYLLGALKAEKKRLIREVHYLASSYGWSLAEILSLSRSTRRTYTSLIEGDV